MNAMTSRFPLERQKVLGGGALKTAMMNNVADAVVPKG